MIDPSKEYETADGRPVYIETINAGGDYPVRGQVCNINGWQPCHWTAEGNHVEGQDPSVTGKDDLVEAGSSRIKPLRTTDDEPEEIDIWLVWTDYRMTEGTSAKNGGMVILPFKPNEIWAERFAKAVKKVSVTKGDGL